MSELKIGIDTENILSPAAEDVLALGQESVGEYFWKDITFSDFKSAILGGVDVSALKANFDSHVADGSAHHTRYTDEEAVTAIKNDPEWGSWEDGGGDGSVDIRIG